MTRLSTFATTLSWVVWPTNGEADACCDVDPCPGHCLNDPCPDHDSDAGTDATTSDGGPSACSGACVPLPPADWQGPFLLSLSPEGSETACPGQAPVIAYQGHAGLNVPSASCGTCSCSAPSGTCAPPLTLTASSKPCYAPGAVTSAFDGPAAWDGACTAQNCISQDPACSQGLSVQSLTATPLIMTEPGCTPSLVVPHSLSTPSWTTAALACRGSATVGLVCSDPSQTCVPAAAPPDFSMCIYHHEDVSCPDAYPDKHLVFAGFDDQRACSSCVCSAPVGSSCSAALSVFKDGTCSVPLLLHSARLLEVHVLRSRARRSAPRQQDGHRAHVRARCLSAQWRRSVRHRRGLRPVHVLLPDELS